ncbi:uncharacterized protein [Montipora foliosa]|uniref:uncharacterized protein n=1 Tax=Montipora foliosa TaxID=591990 RepID=UPI0035F203EA
MTRLFVWLVFVQFFAALSLMATHFYLSLEEGDDKPFQARLVSVTSSSQGRGTEGHAKLKEEQLDDEVAKSSVQTSRRLYLTYQPPDGGWNNHRIAIENALVMAKLLNRTLIVHPVASHDKAISLRKKNLAQWRNFERQWGINWVYNNMTERDLAPISEVLDLKRMRKIVDVFEVKTNHKKFLEYSSNLKWHIVCHSDALGFWVDSIPEGNETLIQRIDFVANNSSRSVRACPAEMRRHKQTRKPVIRRILDELQNVKADIIYLSQDTSYKASVRLFNLEKAREAQKWIFENLVFSPQVYEKTFQILSILPRPFNAIHVRRTDHKVSSSKTPSHWLERMAVSNFLNVSTALFVATDEPNRQWFEPFYEAGYQLYFSDEFLEPSENSFYMDIRGLHDQLICIHASLFVGSKSSSFSGFIHRSRREVMTKNGLVLSHMPVGWLGHKIKT